MRVFFNARHDAHDVKSEFYHGHTIPPLDDPRRMGIIRDALAHKIAARLVEPVDHGMAPIRAVHDARYLHFLSHAWLDWQKAGYDGAAIPAIWPALPRQAGDTNLYHLDFKNIDGAANLRGGDAANGQVQESGSPKHAQEQLSEAASASYAASAPARNMAPAEDAHIVKRLGYYAYAIDTPIGEGSWQAAYWGAQSAISAANALLDDGEAAFCLSRPAGHHAHEARYGGYCLLNNAAIAAQHMRAKGVGRIAILDIDQDHGDGTQQIFYQRGDVLTVSIHASPDTHFPYFTGYAHEQGEGGGYGANLNLPLADGTGFAGFGAAMEQAAAKIASFNADMLIVSLGVNAHEFEPFGRLGLMTSDYEKIGARIAQIGLGTLFVMEGGYAHDVIGQNVAAVLAGFLGDTSAAMMP
ncbi:histone deacetylase family protein [Thalassospira marina]|uniref:Acetylpolyamine amidohydrolase n=1 Tax=Thalassospira marina TaxID=2048283 RepID=A0A2N3KGI8_9PROT|nr:histone deacetylase family protein [Thalassospira marina]PKR49688.1 acetylpolyamine amidohydrolase [Thalassospira marina]